MIIKGRNLEEVLSIAEQETEKDRKLFIYKIIEEKKKTLFHSSEISIDISGFKEYAGLEIKDDNVIYKSGDILPSICPVENASISINGKVINNKTEIKENDSISITPINSEPRKNIKIEVSEDKMEAHIEIKYFTGKSYKIKDADLCNELKPELIISAEVNPQKYTTADAEKLINEKGIKYGIIKENIEKAVKEGGKHIIAKGKAGIKAEDDIINYMFNINEEQKPVEVNGKLDFFNMGEIQFVKKGDHIAEKINGKDGEIGTDIYGNKINCGKRNIKKLSAGKGCELNSDGLKVTALIDGIPVVKGASINVSPFYAIEGNVDMTTGHINFDGDIVVKGNVVEGMKVNAGNTVTIMGGVADAEITAGGTARIGKNIIGSSIKVGEGQIIEQYMVDIFQYFNNVIQNLVNIVDEVDIIRNSRPENLNLTIEQILRGMVNTRFKEVKEKMISTKVYISKHTIKNEFKAAWDKIYDLFESMEWGKPGIQSMLASVAHDLSEYVINLEVSSIPADVMVEYCQNCNIYASHDVEINGKGCFNTDINAGNIVKFSGIPGVLRGGHVFGRNGVYAKEIGSNAGVTTIIKSTKNGIIQADVAYQNTIFYIDELIYKVDIPIRELKVYYEKGELVVEKLKLER